MPPAAPKLQPPDDAKPFDGILVGSLKEWARGKRLADLLLSQVGDEQFIRERLVRYDFVHKSLGEVEVLVKVPSQKDFVRARVEALEALAKETKRDVKTFGTDDAIRLFGTQRWDSFELVYLYARLLRRVDNPAQSYMIAPLLDECHPPAALKELDTRVTEAIKLMDRRLDLDDIGENEAVFWAVVRAIAEGQNLSPLAVIAGHALDSFVIFMALQLATLTAKQSSEPSAPSSNASG